MCVCVLIRFSTLIESRLDELERVDGSRSRVVPRPEM